MKSKKALFKFLSNKFNKTDVNQDNYSISDETYGKKSMIYLHSISKEWGVKREELENILIANGFKVSLDYGRGYGNIDKLDAIEVQVTYFKGHNWNE